MRPVNLQIVQGTPFRYRVRVKELDVDGDMVPMVLDGCVIRLQARLKVESGTVLLDLSSAGTGITIEDEVGTFLIDLSSDDTSAMTWGTPHTSALAVYQCEIEQPGGDVLRILKGSLVIDPEVVR